jgi:hypothetical protein
MDDFEVDLACTTSLGEFIQATQTTKSGHVGVDWNDSFRSAGYHPVVFRAIYSLKHWEQIHSWCQANLGPDHYAWCGMTVFWFETSEAAFLFSLKWL